VVCVFVSVRVRARVTTAAVEDAARSRKFQKKTGVNEVFEL